MRRALRVALVVLAFTGVRSYAATARDARRLPATRRAGAITSTQRPERLRYRVTWNAVPVADAELLIQPEAGGGRAGRVTLRGRAETNEALDLLWRMRDTFEATVSLGPIAPGRFVLHQNENDRRRDTTIVASPPRLLGTVERRHHPARHAEVALAPRLYDPASLAYLIRSLPPELEQRASYAVFAGTKIYELTIAPSGTEQVEVAGRTWPARSFHLGLELEPKDEVQEADLWISSGPERLPLRMSSRTVWGLVTVDLVARGGPAADRL